MGLGGLPISSGTNNAAPPGVHECWGPEQWLFLPELRIRKQLSLLSWDPWGLDVGGGPPSRCCRLWQNRRSGKRIRGVRKRD